MNQIEIAIRDMVEALRTQQYDRAHMLVDSLHVLRVNGTPFPVLEINSAIRQSQDRFDPEG